LKGKKLKKENYVRTKSCFTKEKEKRGKRDAVHNGKNKKGGGRNTSELGEKKAAAARSNRIGMGGGYHPAAEAK